jgi:signal transduction histidine kinase
VERGPHALIRTRLDASEGRDAVRIEVVDHGHGIAEDVLPRVFEPFFSTRPPARGMGLGLAISRTIVEGVGGQIWLENRPEGGAIAIVRLPVASDEEEG